MAGQAAPGGKGGGCLSVCYRAGRLRERWQEGGGQGGSAAMAHGAFAILEWRGEPVGAAARLGKFRREQQ